MSDKRYPTRMHEVLGVEPFEKFQVVGGYEGRNYSLDKDGWMRWGDSYWEADVEDVYNAINNGITRRPRLTEEQVKRLRALIALEAMYLAKNKDGSVGAFTSKPQRNALYWNTNDSYVFYLSIVGTCLSELVSWEDPEPLDIVQGLRENILEGEG